MYSLLKKLALLGLMIASLSAVAQTPPRDFQQILASGELRIGVALFSPWVMRAKDGQLIGSEVDMARRLAADMKLTPQLSVYEWQQLIPALEKGEIDIIIAGMAIKPERALRVNFSRPYGDSGIGLAANSQLTSEFKNLDALKRPEINIGSVKGTASADVAKRMFSRTKLVYFDNSSELEAALVSGKVHAVIASNPQPKFYSLKYPDQVDTPLSKPLLSLKEGLAINKGDADFLNFLDAWVVAHSADAWIASTRHYWFESLEWQEQIR